MIKWVLSWQKKSGGHISECSRLLVFTDVRMNLKVTQKASPTIHTRKWQNPRFWSDYVLTPEHTMDEKRLGKLWSKTYSATSEGI